MNTDKKLIIAAVGVLLLLGIVSAIREYKESRYQGLTPGIPSGSTINNGNGNNSNGDNGVICTQDAKECSDGTYVGRTGPNCEFVCPAATSTTERPGGPLLTGELVGTVMLGPTCPVLRNPPDPQCADKPYKTTVIVATGGKEVGRQVTDDKGNFMFSFLPGTYTVQALGGSTLPRCADETVVIKKAATTTVTVSCDTGIR